MPHETVSSTVSVFKFKFLHYAPHQKRQICVYYGVFHSLHMKIKLTLRNMNGRLYCCYQKSPYQLHVQELHTTQTDRLSDTHTHNMYIIISHSNVHI